MEGSQVPGKRYSRISENLTDDASTKDHHFESFIAAPTLKEAHLSFIQLCNHVGLEAFEDHFQFFKKLKSKITSWKASELLNEIDKRANRKEYDHGNSCPNTKVFIIGAGPCGLRAAIELALLGAKVVLVEKRDKFTRNNVLYLWSYLITDLINLGAKKLYGKLGSGSINHISIIKLQMILLKVALLVGVEIHYNVEFQRLDEHPKKNGWRAILKQKDHNVSKFEFDVIIGADGRQNTLPDFTWKVSSRALAIGITANFVNKQSQNDALTVEIPGKSYIYDQDFFQGLKKTKQIDLENVVYYKDETHYFVMTAKKQSLLLNGVIKKDFADIVDLLATSNVNQKKLEKYAREAAIYSTQEKLPSQEFAKNHNNLPDIALFDFTSRSQATKAALKKEINGKQLLMAVIGDSLKEPFWPEGTGCALGFLGLLDTVWMIRSWVTGERTLDEALHDREVIYKLLSNTKPEDLNKNFNNYGIDPRTRYTSQVALNKILYKQEPKRSYNYTPTISIVPEKRFAPTMHESETVKKTDPICERKIKSTNRFRFSFRRKKKNKEDVVEQKNVRVQKEKSVKKEAKLKKERQKKDKMILKKRSKKEKKEKVKDKKENKKIDLDEKNRNNRNNSKNIVSTFEKLNDEKWTSENKSKSLERLNREYDFDQSLNNYKRQEDEVNDRSETKDNRMQNNGGTAVNRSIADEKKRHKRGWFFRRKIHKDEKKDKDKSQKTVEIKVRKSKENVQQRTNSGNYKVIKDDNSDSSNHIQGTNIKNVSDTESSKSDTKENRWTDSEEVLPNNNKTDKSSGLLAKLGFGRGSKVYRGRERKDYNSLQMEVER